MQDLNDLYFFVQVVDHGGFAARRSGHRTAEIPAQPSHRTS